MTVSILGLGTSVPPHVFYQDDVKEKMLSYFPILKDKQELVSKIYQNSAIQKRHCVTADFHHDRSKWDFWGSDYPVSVPGMSERNHLYRKEAPQLAHEAATKALAEWGGNPLDITHVISVSCTGVVAPGIEFNLMESLRLNNSVNRLGINFMGCFGAFKGLSVAQAFAKIQPSSRILLVCTELCSLHLQMDPDPEILVANALFADGSAAAVIGASPSENEKSRYEISHFCTAALEDTKGKMGWEAGTHGFRMQLSASVPVHIHRHIQPFVDRLLGSHCRKEECNWAIHPGGKSILQAVEKAMGLDSNQTQASWDTLANYGNMSSATFLFVLEELYRKQKNKEWTIGVGFGPGLSIEGVLLR